MTELEYREEKLNLQNELKSLIDNGIAETRELQEQEENRMAEIRTRIDEIDAELQKIDEENRKINEINNKQTRKMETRMNLFNLIKEVANNNVSEENRAYVEGNRINFRDIQATTTDKGKENVPVDKMPLEVAIRNASVLPKLGVKWIDGAVGDIKLVRYNGSNCEWAESENADAVSGDTTFSEITLSPKRLSSYIIVSRQWLDQSPENAEALLIQDLARSISEKIDKTVFGAVDGTSAKPAGLFADSGYTTTGTALTGISFEDVLGLEEKVEKKNGREFCFIADPSVKYALRATTTAQYGNVFVWDKDEIDGRKAFVSNSVNSKSLLCMEPADYACASWGNGLSLIVDPYSLAAKNQIKIVVNYLFDGKLKGDRIAGAIFS